MPKGDILGVFEVQVLAAILIEGENAYGMSIHERVEKLDPEGRTVSLGAVYTTMERLEQKGYVKSWFADPTPERGGKAKRFYEVLGKGELALAHYKKMANSVLKSLAEVGEMR